VYEDRRVLGFRRRPGPDQPNAQMFEDSPDDRRGFNIADDPHDPQTFRTDQRIDLVDILYQPGPVSPEDFFINVSTINVKLNTFNFFVYY
jgi:hypothetical protein